MSRINSLRQLLKRPVAERENSNLSKTGDKFHYLGGTLVLQVQCTTISLRDDENGECIVRPRDMEAAITSELNDDGKKNSAS